MISDQQDEKEITIVTSALRENPPPVVRSVPLIFILGILFPESSEGVSGGIGDSERSCKGKLSNR